MPEFAYTAIAKNGQRSTASIQAPSKAAAGHMLKEQGLLLTEINELNKNNSVDFIKFFSRISLDEKIGTIENLSVMLRAGIPMSRCLGILVKQTRNARFKTILADVSAQVEQGKGLSEAFEKYPGVFPGIVVSMVKVGEMSGNLDKSLEYLTLQLHREADLKSKIRGAMIYPGVITGAMIVIGLLMSIFVLPTLTSIFAQEDATLPLTTRIVIGFSNFMSHHAVLAIGGLIALIVAFIAVYKTHEGKRAFDIASLHMFVVNKIVKKINLARFARILSSLLKSGIPIVQALEVAGGSLGSIPFQEVIMKAAAEVKLGKPVADSLGKDDSLFPALVIQMVEVGEESGSVQEILEQLANHYEEEVDTTLKNLSSIIEPLLLLIIGAIVGTLALALISPIYSIYQNQ